MPDYPQEGKGRDQADSVSQREKFIDAAKNLECDEDEARFDKALRKIGKAKPPKVSPQTSEVKRGKQR